MAGVKQFHNYVYGRFFKLITDHKSLLGLLAGDRQTSQILSPHMMWWTVFLASYKYCLTHWPGKTLGHTNALNCCPLPAPVIDPAPVSSVLLVEDMQVPWTAANLAKCIAKDRILTQVLDWVRRGWPQGMVPAEFQPYRNRQPELSVQKGCLLWESRVLVLTELRAPILKCLHDAHPGVVRMKALGCSYVWWPG